MSIQSPVLASNRIGVLRARTVMQSSFVAVGWQPSVTRQKVTVNRISPAPAPQPSISSKMKILLITIWSRAEDRGSAGGSVRRGRWIKRQDNERYREADPQREATESTDGVHEAAAGDDRPPGAGSCGECTATSPARLCARQQLRCQLADTALSS